MNLGTHDARSVLIRPRTRSGLSLFWVAACLVLMLGVEVAHSTVATGVPYLESLGSTSDRDGAEARHPDLGSERRDDLGDHEATAVHPVTGPDLTARPVTPPTEAGYREPAPVAPARSRAPPRDAH